MENIEHLVNIYNTLNQIEIKGQQNIEYMFGAMKVLKDVILEEQSNMSEMTFKETTEEVI